MPISPAWNRSHDARIRSKIDWLLISGFYRSEKSTGKEFPVA
ncbi:MAG TPA: hypothetical protein VGH74_07335 [Planctomycetaceae bacterium]